MDSSAPQPARLTIDGCGTEETGPLPGGRWVSRGATAPCGAAVGSSPTMSTRRPAGSAAAPLSTRTCTPSDGPTHSGSVAPRAPAPRSPSCSVASS